MSGAREATTEMVDDGTAGARGATATPAPEDASVEGSGHATTAPVGSDPSARDGTDDDSSGIAAAPRRTPSPEPSRTKSPSAKPRRAGIELWIIATALAAIPLAKIFYDLFTGGLGVDPIEELIRRTGWWALTLLVATLAVTPVRRFTGWNRLIQVRKPLGLMAFLYACLHFLTYVGIDQFFALSYIIEDILERPYITAGFTALVMLSALAATSRRDSIRKLGGKKWRRIHSMIYPAALLGVLHYYWLVKADTRPPLVYAAVVVILLAARVRPGAPKGSSKTSAKGGLKVDPKGRHGVRERESHA